MNDIKIWPVPGYEKWYHVSTRGEVYSLAGTKGKFYLAPRLLKAQVVATGYRAVVLFDRLGNKEKGRGNPISIHRVVALTFLPNPENKAEVNHKNGIKHDNRVENLEWATPSENYRHALALGLIVRPRGEHCPACTHTIEQIRQIKRMIADGKSNAVIGRTVGCAASGVSGIRNNKRWTHVVV